MAAELAGFPRPILHGLATYGVVGRVILQTCCGWEPARLKYLRVRFTSPFFPGENLRTEIWRDCSAVSFRCVSIERNVVVLNNGLAEVAE